MTQALTAGGLFRHALQHERPLQIVGAINANHALLAQYAGFGAIYLSGGGVAAGSLGMPDLGINTLEDVLIDVRRITDVTNIPLLIDIDTGFGSSALNIARSIKSVIKAGAAACHIEDQVGAKRCGHRPNKALVSTDEMCDRIKAAVDAKTDESFFLIARTDALESESLEETLVRCVAYSEAGADGLFIEAATELATYEYFKEYLAIPILANMTEFGQTPLYHIDELRAVGVDMVLYPLSAFRAMNKAAETVYLSIRNNGDQKEVLPLMQTREELYERINYHSYEQQIDAILSKK